MSTILIILGIAFIGFIIIAITGKKQEEKVDNLCIDELHKKGIDLDFKTKTISGIIGLSQKNKKLVIIQSNLSEPQYNVFAFEDIYSCELIKDNEVISKKSTTRAIGGAILGEVIGGGTGSIIGGLYGNSVSHNRASLIELKITVKNLKSPTHKITFYNQKKNLASQFKVLANEAEIWKDRISMIIDQVDLE